MMRKYINIINEIYSKDNSYLLRYMQNDEFDPYANWDLLVEWLIERHLDDINEEFETEYDDDEMRDFFMDKDPAEGFSMLPKYLQKEGEDYILNWLRKHAPTELPTTVTMGLLNNKLLNRQTWLIHFSNEAREIARNGFKYGIDQMDRLALTTHMNDDEKKYGGYNFAFDADSKDAKWAEKKGKYGQHAVMFKNSGVKAYHYGDEEHQIMFWGKDVNPRDIVLLYNDGGEWGVVPSKNNLRDGREYVYTGTFEQVVKWVEKNFNQYRKILTGF